MKPPTTPLEAAKQHLASAEKAVETASAKLEEKDLAARAAAHTFEHARANRAAGPHCQPALDEARKAFEKASEDHAKARDELQAAKAGVVNAKKALEQAEAAVPTFIAPTAEERDIMLEENEAVAVVTGNTLKKAEVDLEAMRGRLKACDVERQRLMSERTNIEAKAARLGVLRDEEELFKAEITALENEVAAARTAHAAALRRVQGELNPRVRQIVEDVRADLIKFRHGTAMVPISRLIATLEAAREKTTHGNGDAFYVDAMTGYLAAFKKLAGPIEEHRKALEALCGSFQAELAAMDAKADELLGGAA